MYRYLENDHLAKLVDEGAVTVDVEQTFSLEQAGTALRYLEKEAPTGKVVLTVA